MSSQIAAMDRSAYVRPADSTAGRGGCGRYVVSGACGRKGFGAAKRGDVPVIVDSRGRPKGLVREELFLTM